MADSIDVLIDDQVFLMHARGGISRYFAELLREFRDSPQLGINAITTVRWSPNQHLRAVDPRVRNLPFPELSFGWKAAKRLSAYPAAGRERRARPDVVHSTYYNPARLAEFPGVPKVVTVHDMAPELLPELIGDDPHLAKRQFIEQADAIICVSASTRDDLFELWGEIDDRPVVVTPHATSAAFNPTAPAFQPGYRYVLYVGSRDPYKNFGILLTAFAGSAAQSAGVRIVAVGGGPFSADELALADALGLADALVQITASESDLPGFYTGAVAFVFPSLLEGFGIPVLEAMSCGTPCILADTRIFREVADDAAAFYPARDPWALRVTLNELFSHPAQRAELSGRGIDRADHFTWRRTAELTAEVYRQVADK
ncbi:MAG: glycosyltransferase family 4 protein [Candidatus Nanopelagicales bacterium]